MAPSQNSPFFVQPTAEKALLSLIVFQKMGK
jgi:hypothetical protein